MPKLKSNRGAMKRFKKTGKGGFKHRAAYRNHILTKMTTKRKRHLRGMDMIASADKASLKQMMPFV